MTTDESIMEEMLDRATNPGQEAVDELSLQMFCLVVRSKPQLVERAQEMIMGKIRSNDVTESTRAIALLEECMTKGSTEFQDEVAKYRFLNQLIRLVSKKYQGAETPTPIKQRIMECLLLWTTAFPQKTKIREVYDMLHKEGGVEHGNSAAAVAKRESILGIDEEVLSKLIKSGDPENFKRANLLIQYRVNQESRRTELELQHKSVLQEVQNTVGLLSQMLDAFETEGCKVVEGSETINLMRELFIACKKHKPILQRLPELIENGNESLIADTLETNDVLQAVMKRYKSIVVHSPAKMQESSSSPVSGMAASRSKSSPSPKKVSTGTADLLSDLLAESNEVNGALVAPELMATTTASSVPTSTPPPAVLKPAENKPLDELSEIFGDLMEVGQPNATRNSNVFQDLELLEPVNVFPNTLSTESGANDSPNVIEKRPFRDLPEIDQISNELFKQSLPTVDRIGSFKKEQEKFTLNDLAKEKLNTNSKPHSPSKPPTPTPRTTPIKKSPDLKEEEKSLAAKETIDDDMMLDNATESEPKMAKDNADSIDNEPGLIAVPPMKMIAELPVKHLSEINIDLDDVVPIAEERMLMDDDDVKVTLNFTENRPSRHVSVIVISVCNKSKFSVKDFQFEASVKKPCKVRLLPPTDTTMPPHKPFRPATPINQVMLLLNATGKPVDVTCIVGYKLGDDPDAIKESIMAKDIPFVE